MFKATPELSSHCRFCAKFTMFLSSLTFHRVTNMRRVVNGCSSFKRFSNLFWKISWLTSKSSMDPRQCIVKQCKNNSNIISKLSKRNSKNKKNKKKEI